MSAPAITPEYLSYLRKLCGRGVGTLSVGSPLTPDNALFIATASTAIPALLDALAEANDRIAALAGVAGL